MRIINGVVHPMDRPVIPRGFVAFEQGKITAVGPMEALTGAEDGPDDVSADSGAAGHTEEPAQPEQAAAEAEPAEEQDEKNETEDKE